MLKCLRGKKEKRGREKECSRVGDQSRDRASTITIDVRLAYRGRAY